jgi:plastocyanin
MAAARDYVVTVTDLGFSPAELTIQKEDMVRWEWESGSHTIVDGDPDNPEDAGQVFEFPVNAQNLTFEFTFDESGTFEYFSLSDPDLRGTITVLEGTPVDRATWGWIKKVFENDSAARNRR